MVISRSLFSIHSIFLVVFVTSSIASDGNREYYGSNNDPKMGDNYSVRFNDYSDGSRGYTVYSHDEDPAYLDRTTPRGHFAYAGPATTSSPVDSDQWIAHPFNAYSTKRHMKGHYTYPNINYSDRETVLDPEYDSPVEYVDRERRRGKRAEQGFSSSDKEKEYWRVKQDDQVKQDAMKHLSHYDGRYGQRGILHIPSCEKVLYHHGMPYQEAERRYEAGNLPILDTYVDSDGHSRWQFRE